MSVKEARVVRVDMGAMSVIPVRWAMDVRQVRGVQAVKGARAGMDTRAASK